MNKIFSFMLAAVVAGAATAVAQVPQVRVDVQNRSGIDRREIVEVPMQSIESTLRLGKDKWPVVTNERGEALPTQVTHDSLLLFPVDLKPYATGRFTVVAGTPTPVDTLVTGAFYAKRKDDLAWENDLTAYRAYGPELQRSGERAFGYDVWTKSVNYPVVAHRYAVTLDPRYDRQQEILHKIDHEAARQLQAFRSFHEDHGTGMDRYAVGPTLGCGTDALLTAGDSIVYPWAFSSYEILDNGPLRFTARLEYPPFTYEGQKGIVEVRTISLDLGSQLNKTSIVFRGLKGNAPIAVGLVIHPANPTAYVMDKERGYIGYEDPTERPGEGYGMIYVGAVMPERQRSVEARLFSAEESKRERGGATGHVLSIGTYKPGKPYTYYWGSAWSKYNMPSLKAWKEYLEKFSIRARRPLKVTVGR